MFNWLLQRISGLILFVGLIVHFYIMHYSGAENITFEAVMTRLSSPLWKAFDIIFLVSVLYHGFNGLWGISIEYIKKEGNLKNLRAILVLLSIMLFLKGVTIIL